MLKAISRIGNTTEKFQIDYKPLYVELTTKESV